MQLCSPGSVKPLTLIPDNKIMAERRLVLLKKWLKRDPRLLAKYKETMGDYLAKSHARRITAKDPPSKDDAPVWYLPHHPVVHPQKPKKVRIVFVCIAKFCNTSLNDQLLQGPDFTNSLVGVLLRFREERVALMADIEKMFHQVRVNQKTVRHCNSCGAQERTLIRTQWITKCWFISLEQLHHQAVVHMHSERQLRITEDTSVRKL